MIGNGHQSGAPCVNHSEIGNIFVRETQQEVTGLAELFLIGCISFTSIY